LSPPPIALDWGKTVCFPRYAEKCQTAGPVFRRKAAENYRGHLDATDRGPNRPVQRSDGVAEALKFLSQYAKDEGSLPVAAKYCSRLLECGGAEEEWAKKQLKEIKLLEQGNRSRALGS